MQLFVMCILIGGDFTRGDGTGGESGTVDPSKQGPLHWTKSKLVT